MEARMAVCVPALLIVAKNDSAFGWVGTDDAIEGPVLVVVG